MNSRGLIIAAFVLTVLSGVLLWSYHRKPLDETPKASADTPPKILSVNQSDVTRLSFVRKGDPELALSKDASGSWQITSPKPLRADADAVSGVLSTLSSLDSERLIEAKAADLAPYGLAAPSLRLEITTKDSKAQTLLLGDATPTGNGAYAALAGDPRVFTIVSYNKSSLDKTLGDLRDKRLLTADFDKVTQIELVDQNKKQDITFARDKDAWQILKPRPYRAESSQVEDVIRALKDAKLETASSADDAKNASAFNSASPFVTAKITGASGTQELQLRKAKDDYYAKSSIVPGIFKVSSSTATALDKSLDDFRNRKLFDFGFQDPDKVEIHDGAKSYFLTRSSSDWWGADGKQLDFATVQPLLDKLRDLAATKFPDSGFTSPVIEITVVSNDKKRTEKIALSKSGDSYIAKRENEPALYELTAASIGDLEQAAAGLKAAPAPATPAPKK